MYHLMSPGRGMAAKRVQLHYGEESCQIVRGLKLICEEVRGDIRVVIQGPYIRLIMGLIT